MVKLTSDQDLRWGFVVGRRCGASSWGVNHNGTHVPSVTTAFPTFFWNPARPAVWKFADGSSLCRAGRPVGLAFQRRHGLDTFRSLHGPLRQSRSVVTAAEILITWIATNDLSQFCNRFFVMSVLVQLNSNSAGVLAIELIQRNEFVNDQVDFITAPTSIANAASQHNGVRLHRVTVLCKVFRRIDARHDALRIL